MRHDGGEQRRVGLDEIADRDEAPVDAARQRRLDLGEFDIEAGSLKRGGCSLKARLGSKIFAPAVVQNRGRQVAAVGEFLGALQLQLAKIEQARRDIYPRLCSIVSGLIGALVDGEEQVALLHQRAVGEMDLFEIAADARPDRDLVDRLEAADELVVLDDVADDRFRRRDDRRLLLLRQGLYRQEQAGKQPDPTKNAPKRNLRDGCGVIIRSAHTPSLRSACPCVRLAQGAVQCNMRRASC